MRRTGRRSRAPGSCRCAEAVTTGLEKVLVVVDPGAVVTLVLSPVQRRRAALLFDPRNWRRFPNRISQGEWKATFQGCTAPPPVQQTPGLEPTQFNGGF